MRPDEDTEKAGFCTIFILHSFGSFLDKVSDLLFEFEHSVFQCLEELVAYSNYTCTLDSTMIGTTPHLKTFLVSGGYILRKGEF